MSIYDGFDDDDNDDDDDKEDADDDNNNDVDVDNVVFNEDWDVDGDDHGQNDKEAVGGENNLGEERSLWRFMIRMSAVKSLWK